MDIGRHFLAVSDLLHGGEDLRDVILNALFGQYRDDLFHTLPCSV